MAIQANWQTSVRRYQTKLYATIGAVGLLLSFGLRGDAGGHYETIVAAGVAMAGWILLVPSYARFAISAEDAINLRFGQVSPRLGLLGSPFTYP